MPLTCPLPPYHSGGSPIYVLDVSSSGIEAPASGKGMQFQVFVQTTSTSAGSVRLWLPDMRRQA